jgi:hypothetical protein
VTLDTMLFLAGTAAEAVVVSLILFRRIFRTLPVFSSYIVWSIFNDAGLYALVRLYPHSDHRIFLVATIIDSVFQFGVLVELSMSVLRPVRASLPRGAAVAVVILIGVLCAIVWPFARTMDPDFDAIKLTSRLLIHLQFTTSVVRILFFLALAGLSQLLSIGWRDRELQIATGLGFYSIASLSVSLLHTNQATGNAALLTQYHYLDQMVAATYVCSIVYWGISFAQKVPERREFTPQMESFLLAVAGSARSAKVALSESAASKTGTRGKP